MASSKLFPGPGLTDQIFLGSWEYENVGIPAQIKWALEKGYTTVQQNV